MIGKMKNSINIAMRLLAISSVVLFLASCTADPIKDYYEQPSGVNEGTVMDCLEKNPEYSKFVALLKETGVDKELVMDNLVTVWVPNNRYMPSDAELEAMDLSDKEFLARNHISNSVISEFNLGRMSLVRTLAQKALSVEVNDGIYFVDGIALNAVKYNQRFENGIVHEMDGLVKTKKNIYQFIHSLSGDFSIFKKTLFARKTVVYDTLNAPIKGIGHDGKPIRDWEGHSDTINDIFIYSDVRDEDRRFTMFIPNDAACLGMMEAYTNLLNSYQYPISSADTAKWMEWFLKASIHDSELSLTWNDSLISANTTTEHVYNLKTRYQNCYDSVFLSNGVVYLLDGCYVPRSIYFSTQIISPYDLRMTTFRSDGVTAGSPFKGGNYAKPVIDPNDGDLIDRWTNYAPVQSEVIPQVQEVRFQFIQPNKDWGGDSSNDASHDPAYGRCYPYSRDEEKIRLGRDRTTDAYKSAMLADPSISSAPALPTYMFWSFNIDTIDVGRYTVTKKPIMPGDYTVYIRLGNTTVTDGTLSLTDSVHLYINNSMFRLTGINTPVRPLRPSPIPFKGGTGAMAGSEPRQPNLGLYDYPSPQGGLVADHFDLGLSTTIPIYAPVKITLQLPIPHDVYNDMMKWMDQERLGDEVYGPKLKFKSNTRLTAGRVTLVPHENY